MSKKEAIKDIARRIQESDGCSSEEAIARAEHVWSNPSETISEMLVLAEKCLAKLKGSR